MDPRLEGAKIPDAGRYVWSVFNRLMLVGVKGGCFHSELLAWCTLQSVKLSAEEVDCLGRMYVAFENEKANQMRADKSKPPNG